MESLAWWLQKPLLVATCRLAHRLWSPISWAGNLRPLLTCCVLLDKSLKLPGPQFSHLKDCCNCYSLVGQMAGVTVYVQCLEGHLAHSKHSVNVSLFSVIPALSCSFYRAKAGDCLAFHMWLVQLFLLGNSPPERCLAHTRISMCCCMNAYIFLGKWVSCPVAQAYLVPGSCLI